MAPVELNERTYERERAKRVYYLSMESLIGRSLDNNGTNLLLDPIVNEARGIWGGKSCPVL